MSSVCQVESIGGPAEARGEGPWLSRRPDAPGRSGHRTRAGNGCEVCLVGGHQADGLLGAVYVAAVQIAFGEAGERRNVLWVFLEHAGIYFRCALQVARLERLIRRLDSGRSVGSYTSRSRPLITSA